MFCLDTSFLIDLLHGDEAARSTLEELEDESRRQAVTPVTATELWIGAQRGSIAEYQETEELLESLLWLDISRSCTRRAGRLQSNLMDDGSELGFNDCLIAATALEHGYELVTADGDFERVPDLRVRTY